MGQPANDRAAPRIIVRRGQVTVIPAAYTGPRSTILPGESKRASLYARPGAVATEATTLLAQAFAKGSA